MPVRSDVLNTVIGFVRADRARGFAMAVAAVLTVATSIWFFTARDDRGRTARLTADAWYYHAYLPSLVHDRDLDFADEYKITGNWYRLGKHPDGRYSNVFGIGPAVFELPFFVTGAAVTRVSGGNADGFSTAEVTLSLLASLLFSLGALAFAWRLIRRRLGGTYLPMLAPVALWLAGPVVYYAVKQPGYAHPFATFFAAWLIDAWDRSYDGPRPRSLGTWLGLGALLGAAALARPQLGLWAVILAFAAVDDLRHGLRQAAGQAAGSASGSAGRRVLAAVRVAGPRWAAGAAMCVLVLSPQLLAWKSLHGQFYVVPQGDGFMRWDAPAWSEVLFSSRNGLLPWAPLYALAAIGLAVAAWRVPRLGVALLVGVALQTVANGAAWDWWAGGSFGGRRFDSCFAAFAFGLAALLVIPMPRPTPRLIPRPTPRQRGLRWARTAWLAVAGALMAALAAGNVILAGKISAPSARIHGGQAAHVVLATGIGGPVGKVTAQASRVANFPARAAFAWRHGTGLDAYDRVVGVHQLGELYPGLNSFKGKTVERVTLAKAPHRLIGLRRAGAAVEMIATRARILIGLNRFGPVTVNLRVDRGSPPGHVPGPVIVRLNGAEIARGDIGEGGGTITGVVDEVERGVNVVEVEAAAGTRLSWLELRGPVDPRATRPARRTAPGTRP